MSGMDIRTWLSGWRSHRMMVALLLLQVALACAILCNILFLLGARVGPLLQPLGIDTQRLVVVGNIVSFRHTFSAEQIQRAEQLIRTVPGVTSVAVGRSLPLLDTLSRTAKVHVSGARGGVDSTVFEGHGLVPALGLKLAAGRDFGASDYGTLGGKGGAGPHVVILSRALAGRLFAGGNALGKTISFDDGDQPRLVIGVVDRLAGLQGDAGPASPTAGNSVIVPVRIGKAHFLGFEVRVGRGRGAMVARRLDRLLGPLFADTDSSIRPTATPASEQVDAIFATRRATVWLLASVAVVVAVVVAMGIMGLTGFWVQQRTRQIGIRRALGARRRQILGQFMAENLLVTLVGAAFGMIAAYGINLLLMRVYELPRLPWTALPVGAAALCVLGQLAVLGPALRAARVPPVVATRVV